MITTYHMSVNLQGLLNNYKRRKITFMMDDNGIELSDREARLHIHNLQAMGHKLMPCGECEGFDPFGNGCPGHEVKDEIAIGKKFTSKWFQGECEMISCDIDKNELWVRITRDTNSHTEAWNLEHTKVGFERGDYVACK
jgi:hypothetical protein